MQPGHVGRAELRGGRRAGMRELRGGRRAGMREFRGGRRAGMRALRSTGQRNTGSGARPWARRAKGAGGSHAMRLTSQGLSVGEYLVNLVLRSEDRSAGVKHLLSGLGSGGQRPGAPARPNLPSPPVSLAPVPEGEAGPLPFGPAKRVTEAGPAPRAGVSVSVSPVLEWRPGGFSRLQSPYGRSLAGL